MRPLVRRYVSAFTDNSIAYKGLSMETTLMFGDFAWIALIMMIFGGGTAYFINTEKTMPPLESLPIDIIEGLKFEPDIGYSIQIHNDNITSMDHVIEILEKYCGVSKDDSINIMLEVHKKNIAILPLKIEQRVAKSIIKYIDKASIQRGFPLKCSIKKV
jgi:ATP-dependent Clp protease adapter protein ClpS